MAIPFIFRWLAYGLPLAPIAGRVGQAARNVVVGAGRLELPFPV